jgi:glucose uptake protein GlcU
MFNSRDIFQKVSYLQYPLMFTAMYYILKPYFIGFDTIFVNYNYALIFMGLGISFSTLQDTTKTQNEFSKKVWENPIKGKLALMIISFLALFLILIGFYGVYISENENLKQLSYGIIVLGIGIVGLLKSAIEMFENHRLDKKI